MIELKAARGRSPVTGSKLAPDIATDDTRVFPTQVVSAVSDAVMAWQLFAQRAPLRVLHLASGRLRPLREGSFGPLLAGTGDRPRDHRNRYSSLLISLAVFRYKFGSKLGDDFLTKQSPSLLRTKNVKKFCRSAYRTDVWQLWYYCNASFFSPTQVGSRHRIQSNVRLIVPNYRDKVQFKLAIIQERFTGLPGWNSD